MKIGSVYLTTEQCGILKSLCESYASGDRDDRTKKAVGDLALIMGDMEKSIEEHGVDLGDKGNG